MMDMVETSVLERPLVSQSALDNECKPLDVAMNILRQRAHISFRSGYVRVVRKQNNTQHAPMAFVDGGLIQR